MHYICICAIPGAWRKNHLGPEPASALLAGFLRVALPRRKSVARAVPQAAIWRWLLGANLELALNTHSVTSRTLACAFPPVAGQRLGPTARLQRKSAVCGLNGFLPRLCLGSLQHLNPRPPISGLLPFRLFSRRGKRETRASVLERKIALWGLIFPPKRNPKDSWREGEDQGEHGPIPLVRDKGRLIKNNTNWIYKS
jgi:hypothetical protein